MRQMDTQYMVFVRLVCILMLIDLHWKIIYCWFGRAISLVYLYDGLCTMRHVVSCRLRSPPVWRSH